MLEKTIPNLVGEWFVGNPDRGEILKEKTDRIIVWGLYTFYQNSTVHVDLKTRDARGKVYPEARSGRFEVKEMGPEITVRVSYVDGNRESFVWTDQDRLRRQTTTYHTCEQGLEMWPHQPRGGVEQPGAAEHGQKRGGFFKRLFGG